jgi:osmotically-inducible protein OsmY
MKTNNQIKTYFNWICIFSIILLSASSINFAQVDTKQLENEVWQKISNYYLEKFNISADQTGVIAIEGEVSTLFDKLKIGELISQVEGVRRINNKIGVRTATTADNTIKANIEYELQINSVILEPERIKVEVNKGVVNLSGTVSYFREKLMAQSIATWQDGVTDMTSNLVVLSPTVAKSDDNLEEVISDILKKHFSSEKNARFKVLNGEVNLYGSVGSLYAKNHIQEEIHHLLGVKDVINEIRLENN